MGWFDGDSLSNPFGGDNSIFNNPGQVFGGDNSFFRKPFGSKPDPVAPPAPPDPATARTDALNAQIDQELQIRRSNTAVTGGMGVDGQPQVQSAGQLLFGS